MTNATPKFAIGQKVLYNDRIHIVESTNDVNDGWGGHKVANTYNLFDPITQESPARVPEIYLLPLIKESDGKVYGTTKPKATRPRKKVFSTDKSGK